MSRVYAPVDPAGKFNLTKVVRFGSIISIIGDGHQAAPLNNIADTVVKMHDKLEDFCDHDYILPVGNPTLIGVLAAIAMHYNEGRAMFLHWDKKINDYIPVCVDMFE